MKLVDTKNAGLTIIRQEEVTEKVGYVIAESDFQYATWQYGIKNDGSVDYFWGHYFIKEGKNPRKVLVSALCDFHKRLMNSFEFEAKNTND